jgi:tetratricopeptide (TPR) repeat protein
VKTYFLIAIILTLSGAEAQQDSVTVNRYNRLAQQYRETYPDSVRYYGQKAAAIAQRSGYGYGLAHSRINLGNAALIFGDYPLAIREFKAAQSAFETLLAKDGENKELQNGLARSFANQGVAYSEQSNYFHALDRYRQAAALFEKAGNRQALSKAYNNIAVVYKSQQQYAKALEFLQKALKIQEATGEETLGVTLTNMGAIAFEQGDRQKAIGYYTQAQKKFTISPNARAEALLQNYLGDYYKSVDNEKAMACYRKALAGYEALENKFGESLALYNLGQLEFDLRKFSDAMPLAEKSLEYAREIAVPDQVFHSEKLLSDIYQATGNPDAALEHYKAYVAARDTVYHQENAKKLAIAEMNFDYRKKEALLEEKAKRERQLLLFSVLGTLLAAGLVLLAYNRRQVKRRLTLEKEVAEYEQKALHLQMNPHFVFNCLSAISSFIVQNGTDQALKYLSKFSKLMRLTLEYSKDALIPIDKETESLENYLELEQLRFRNKFTFAITVSDSVEFNVGLPPLLIQPFVENAILHGIVPKETAGRIDVSFDQENGQLICSISDDGIGLAQSRLMKEDSVAAHRSMALEITRKRLEIMETATSRPAQIEIADLYDGKGQTGTRVTLRLPLQYMP